VAYLSHASSSSGEECALLTPTDYPGKVDVLLAVPPEAQELQAKRIGHVVVNTMRDNNAHHMRSASLPTGVKQILTLLG
jgi:hypothetical protein